MSRPDPIAWLILIYFTLIAKQAMSLYIAFTAHSQRDPSHVWIKVWEEREFMLLYAEP